MSDIRVLLAVGEPSRGWLTEAIALEPDMRIVGEAADPLETLLLAREGSASIVLVDLPESGEDPGIASHLLVEFPRLAVVAVSSRRDRLRVFQAVLHREELIGDSATEIGPAIRRARDGTAPTSRGPSGSVPGSVQ